MVHANHAHVKWSRRSLSVAFCSALGCVSRYFSTSTSCVALLVSWSLVVGLEPLGSLLCSSSTIVPVESECACISSCAIPRGLQSYKHSRPPVRLSEENGYVARVRFIRTFCRGFIRLESVLLYQQPRASIIEARIQGLRSSLRRKHDCDQLRHKIIITCKCCLEAEKRSKETGSSTNAQASRAC